MINNIVKRSIVVLLFTGLNFPAIASSPPPTVPENFIQKIVAAYNSHNFDNFLPLFHPKVAACITDKNKDKFAQEFWFGRKNDQITTPYKVTYENIEPGSEKIINDTTKNPFAKYSHMPVIQDYNVRMDFKPKPNSHVSKLFRVKWDGGAVYLVSGCLTPEGQEKFDKNMAEKAAQENGLRAKWNTLDKKTRSELMAGVKEGSTLGAQKAMEEKLKLNATQSNMIARMIENGDL